MLAFPEISTFTTTKNTDNRFSFQGENNKVSEEIFITQAIICRPSSMGLQRLVELVNGIVGKFFLSSSRKFYPFEVQALYRRAVCVSLLSDDGFKG